VIREVVVGETVAAIVRAAQKHHVDLVCMTTHRWSDVDRWLNGSVMDAVLRETNLPLLVVPPDSTAEWSVPSGPVLVALDGSPTAEAVLPIATDLATVIGAPICLIRVDRDLVAAASYLAEVRSRIPCCTVDTTVASGAAATAITVAARDERAPLIAMATHGRTGLERLVLGSVATHVLHEAGMPVLLIRPALVDLASEAEANVPTTTVAPWLVG
jgi:nucleotide-binding universal stress UspA family protein